MGRRAVHRDRTGCSRSSFDRSSTLRSTTAASRRLRSIGRSNVPCAHGPPASSPLRQGGQRTAHESNRSSGARGPVRVVASELLHRPRLSRSGLRELRHEDHVLHVGEEGIEVLLDGSLKFTAELRAELIRAKEAWIARHGVHDQPVLSRPVDVHCDRLGFVHELVLENNPGFLRTRLYANVVYHVLDSVQGAIVTTSDALDLVSVSSEHLSVQSFRDVVVILLVVVVVEELG